MVFIISGVIVDLLLLISCCSCLVCWLLEFCLLFGCLMVLIAWGVVGGFPLVVACFSCLVDVFVWVVALVLVAI